VSRAPGEAALETTSTLAQIGDLARVANGSDDAVAPLEELLGQLAAEAAVDARYEPCALCRGSCALAH